MLIVHKRLLLISYTSSVISEKYSLNRGIADAILDLSWLSIESDLEISGLHIILCIAIGDSGLRCLLESSAKGCQNQRFLVFRYVFHDIIISLIG